MCNAKDNKQENYVEQFLFNGQPVHINITLKRMVLPATNSILPATNSIQVFQHVSVVVHLVCRSVT